MPGYLPILLVAAGPALAATPLGEWLTEGGKARVRIEACQGAADQLCGRITWSYRPEGAPPGPLRDVNNRDAALRQRPIVGLPLLQGLKPAGAGAWSDGTIYDPEGGRTYKAKLRLDGAGGLRVEGCILFVCRGQAWQRYGDG